MNCALESEVQIAKTRVLAKQPKRYIIARVTSPGPAAPTDFLMTKAVWGISQDLIVN